MSVEVESLWKYPVTGGPGIAIASTEVYPGGFLGDRAFIVAEQLADDSLQRLGSKQAPDLLGITYDTDGQTAYLDGNPLRLPSLDFDLGRPAQAHCNEFGDDTPVWFTSPDHDAAFSDYLGRPVHLLQKTTAWLLGEGIPPYQRANAALHIISAESVAQIAEDSGAEAADVRKFKPDIVLSGMRAHEELDMIGKMARIGSIASGATLQIDRGTRRCLVTALDPTSGENKGDISLRAMPKVDYPDGKPGRSAGVYAHTVDAHDRISVKDIFRLLE
ncbi:MAG TPA: hypothetical protein VK694_05335 [Verrucomicrobiae bacterium]|nr:hypothetical protein [Verrucomicrobiae bacterium]